MDRVTAISRSLKDDPEAMLNLSVIANAIGGLERMQFVWRKLKRDEAPAEIIVDNLEGEMSVDYDK